MNRTVDTDVMVLAVSVTQGLQLEDELSLAFTTCKSFRYLAAHEIAAGLGPEKAWALPMFHALTGCEAWAIWSVLPELTDELLELFTAPSDIPEDVMHAIDRFVNRLYERATRARNSSQRKQCASDPANQGNSGEHVKRAAYQGGHVWGQTLLPAPELPPPTSWGWAINDIRVTLDKTTRGRPHLL